jgi:hypothetical protein
VEMEAEPLARWALARGVPFVHLRVVLDPASTATPSARPGGERREADSARAYLLRALSRPRAWPATWQLFRQAGQASRVLTGAIRALAQPGGPLARSGP